MNKQTKLENVEYEKKVENIHYLHQNLISPSVIKEYWNAVDPVVALVMFFNFTSSVSIVSVNKYVTQLGFRFSKW